MSNKNNNVMSAVASVIDFIKTQVSVDLMTASDRGILEKRDINELKKISRIVEQSISTSFVKSSDQIENALEK